MIGIFIIPVFYVLVAGIAERFGGGHKNYAEPRT
jgi:hypothetical protein